jgi:hypothetical protein
MRGGGAGPVAQFAAPVDQAITVPTAGYAQNVEAPIVSAAGTNLMVNTPKNFSELAPACVKTGGGRRSRRASKKSKKTKKSRKSSKKGKKGKKGSRKH